MILFSVEFTAWSLLILFLKFTNAQSDQDFPMRTSHLVMLSRRGDCPPCPSCFNCLLGGECLNNGTCSSDTGRCVGCPTGFGGDDCSVALCGGLTDPKRKPAPTGQSCTCNDGWSGPNCNVCEIDDVCNSFDGQDLNYTCYKDGIVVGTQYRRCLVDLPPYLDLGGNEAYVTTECTRKPEGLSDCNFQFWVASGEAFYCSLHDCDLKSRTGNDSFSYTCPKVSCQCIPNSFTCQADGLDLTDMLTQAVGPGIFECQNSSFCVFHEPVLDIFLTGGTKLACSVGECLRPSQIPGYIPPKEQFNTVLIVAITVTSLVVLLLLILLFLYYVKRQQQLMRTNSQYVDDEADKLRDNHTPVTLVFKEISYYLSDNCILNQVSGCVRPGEVMAIIGGSGAGKSTCLDILAGKLKKGKVQGDIFMNGHVVNPSHYRQVIGFVDQEDTLLGTLTVRETLMYSAMLRLPRKMSLQAKKLRVQQTMEELGISHIADRRIGLPGMRGISGGEKRRVSIAQELVTSPSILFLDEPTSGLDAYNAYVVVDTLVRLAREYHRTIVLSIHQPRSNVYAKFDQLLLLAGGQVIYSGNADETARHFAELGYPCPLGYNTADFLIDLTMKNEDDLISETSGSASTEQHTADIQPTLPVPASPERPLLVNSVPSNSVAAKDSWFHQFIENWWPSRHHRRHKSKRSQLAEQTDIERRLTRMRDFFPESSAGRILNQVLTNVPDKCSEPLAKPEDGDLRTSYVGQLRILTGRTLLNLYRNPFLLMAHYGISLVLAVFLGFLFWQCKLDIAGVQNRIGCLFFLCAYFAFASITTLELFASERLLFSRERSNGFYSTSAYYFTKIFFDFLPLRMVPPLLLGSIMYFMVGFYPQGAEFGKFLLMLVIFNLVCSAICLNIAIIFKQTAIGNLVAVLTMLFSMLFGGFLLNKGSLLPILQWMKYLSAFNYAYEALAVNELAKVTLHDSKIVEIQIPGSIILDGMGFDIYSYWSNAVNLSVMFFCLLVTAYVLLKILVKEKR